jgi:hypothetical protein
MGKPVPSEVSSIKLDQLVYVELEANNGGMMLTVSEEGFSFRAVTPVRATGRTAFSFTINGTQKLSGFGKIEWSRDEGKVAGLQFTDVSSQFHDELRTWLAQLGSPTVSSSTEMRTEEPGFKSSEGTSRTASELLPDPQPVGLNFGRSLSGGLPDAVVAPPVFERTVSGEPPRTFPALTEWKYPEDSADTQAPRVNKVAIAAGVVCLLALAIFLYGFRTGIGESLISVGQKLSGPSEKAQNADSAASETTADNVRSAPSADSARNDSPSSVAKTEPGPAAGDRDTQTNSESTVESRKTASGSKPDKAFEDAQVRSSGLEGGSLSDSRDAGGQSHGLWTEVAKGNTSAEVTLAQLYLIGRGVPKSCAQAKVLLQAAAKKGNVEAIDKLAQIRRQGCP